MMKRPNNYDLIIQKILIHPQQIGKILDKYPHYFDHQLLKLMKDKADLMASQGNQIAASFLESLVRQLQEELMITQTISKEKSPSIIQSKLETNSSGVRTSHDHLISTSNMSLESSHKRKSSTEIRKVIPPQIEEEKDYFWSKWVAIIMIIGFAFLCRYYAINSKLNESKPTEHKPSILIEMIRFFS